jgi:nickel superoxide dismutase
MKFPALITPASAHCDLACGIYDPAQARIEAQSVYNAIKKYEASEDESFRVRAIVIKEERAELVKHHLWVLWTDYFKPEHAAKHPELHDLFWRATKAAGEAKKSMELDHAEELIKLIDEVGTLFAATKEGYNYDAVRANCELQAA